MWENKAILFLTDVVLSMRQVRPQKLPHAEAGARKRKRAARRQAARRCRLRQVEKDADGRAEGGKGKEKTEEEELELEDVEASEGEPTLLQTPQDSNARPLAPDTVETCYVSALCALYDDQALADLNTHPHPRGKGLKALVERLKIDWTAEKRRTLEDRAINDLNDGYTIEQAGRLCALLLRGGMEDGRQLVIGADLHLLRTV